LRDGVLVVLWLAAAAGWGAWPTEWLLRVRGDSARTAVSLPSLLTAIAVGLGILGILILGLGSAGVLGFTTAWGLLGIGWVAVAAWIARRRRQSKSLSIEGPAPPPRVTSASAAREAHCPAWRWFWLLAAPALSAALVSTMFPPGMLWKPEEPHGYDAVEYHLQVPREWYETGRIAPLEHNVFSYFPFGVEMHYLLAFHLRGGAWAGMYLAQLIHLAMTALAAAAAGAFAIRLSSDRRIAVIASVAGATVPFLAQLAPMAFNEGGLLLFGTLCVGWTVLAMRDLLAGKPSGRRFVLAGVLAGLACGVKLTAGPLLLVGMPLAILAAAGRRAPRAAIAGVLVFGLAGVAAFSPWLVRNAVWCGNPVFPEATSLFGKAHFTDVQVERWARAHHPQPERQPAAGRVAAFGTEVAGNWQFGFVLLPLAVVGAAMARGRPEAVFLAVLMLVHVVFWLGFTHLQGRFFVLAVPVAVLLVAAVPWGTFGGSRFRFAVPALAVVVTAAAVLGWWGVHVRLRAKLDSLRDERGVDARGRILADDQIGWLTEEVLSGFPQDDPSAKLLLAGDAQAFWYPVPASRLRYRTPFDVREGPEVTVFQVYGVDSRDGRTWVRVDPDELDRFDQTYQPFPTIPEGVRRSPAWRAKPPMPYLLPPSAAANQGVGATRGR
jgi:hypothetical protein